MFADIRGLKHFKEEKGQLVELGRLNFTANGMARIYLPKRVCNRLKLDKEKDSTLIILSHTANSLFLIKDSKAVQMLKPEILKKRRPTFANNKYRNKRH